MLIPFRKMQAQGNDFLILELLEARDYGLPLEELARDACDRRKGFGADGLVVLLGDPQADARMVIHNSDGGRAQMCGSALRCCAIILHSATGQDRLRLATDSGIREAVIQTAGSGATVEVSLGSPGFLEEELIAAGVTGSLVDVGNLHFVSFRADIQGQELALGPLLENHPRFPGAVNSEFVRVLSRQSIELVVWERGCGATQACGSGAVASVFTGIRKGLLDNKVLVRMPGGEVLVRQAEGGEMLLAGCVADIGTGVYRWKI